MAQTTESLLKALCVLKPIYSSILYPEIKIYNNPELTQLIKIIDPLNNPNDFAFFEVYNNNNWIPVNSGLSSEYNNAQVLVNINQLLQCDRYYISYIWKTELNEIISNNPIVYPSTSELVKYSGPNCLLLEGVSPDNPDSPTSSDDKVTGYTLSQIRNQQYSFELNENSLLLITVDGIGKAVKIKEFTKYIFSDGIILGPNDNSIGVSIDLGTNLYPGIKYDKFSKLWLYSNDGINWNSFNQGGSEPTVIPVIINSIDGNTVTYTKRELTSSGWIDNGSGTITDYDWSE